MTPRKMFLRTTIALVAMLTAVVPRAGAQTIESVSIRGHQQRLHVYGTRGIGDPVLLSSGDGGWMHLAPRVADRLVARGYFVVGFDAKAYLQEFTSGTATLRPEDVPGDYRLLVEYAARGASKKPMLMGVSEGAALSVLAAADAVTKRSIAGVVSLGLGDRNELGWRWKDSIIYLTHGVPNEPTFSVAAVVDKLTPLPLAEIHSSRDEFAPIAEVQRIVEKANPPKRLWIVEASDHRFSDNFAELERRLFEAIEWVNQNQPR
jgi:hypothetical protein